MSTTGTMLELLDRDAGELVDIRTATPTRLAQLVDAIDGLIGILVDEKTAVSDELVGRLDLDGTYTLMVGDGSRRWKITAPSKTVGASKVDKAILRDELVALVDRADPLISAELARAALRRRLVIEATVDVDEDVDVLTGKLAGLDAIAGAAVFDVKTAVTESVVAAGVAKLVRAGHADVVARATVAVEAPRRRATVKREAT